jgi:WD40 repeat protein
MDSQLTSIQLRGPSGSISPSFLPNNLSSSSSDVLAFSRLNEVYLLRSGTLKTLDLSKTKIYQVGFLNLKGDDSDYLAIASNLGFHIWSEQGDNLIFFYPISALNEKNDEEPFMRGLTSIDNSICVGTSTGNVVVFDYSKSSSDVFSVAFNLESDGKPISVLSSSKDTIVAGNDCGALFGYEIFVACRRSFSFPATGHPCTALVQKGAVLFAGFSTGHLRVYRTDIHELALEVSAHTRAITGMVINANIVASCSPDQYLHIWSIPEFDSVSSSAIYNVSSTLIENKICTGIAFSGDLESLIIANYDDDELTVVNIKNCGGN